MPSNDFEQRLRERLANAEYPPQPEVWAKLSGRLDAIPWWKDRRWLIAALFLLAISIGSYFYKADSELAQQRFADPSEQLQSRQGNNANQHPSEENMTEGHIKGDHVIEYDRIQKRNENPIPGGSHRVLNIGSHNQQNVLDTEESSGKLTEQSVELSGSELSKDKGSFPIDNEEVLVKGNEMVAIPEITFLDQRRKTQSEPEEVIDTFILSPYLASGRPQIRRNSRMGISLYASPLLAWYTSTNFRVDQDRNQSEAPVRDMEFVPANQTVFYDITYSRSGIEAGINLSYEISSKFQLQSGIGFFQSGEHQLSGITLNPVFDDFRKDQFELEEVEVARSTFRTAQLVVPLEGLYYITQGRGQWIVSLGGALNANLSDFDFPEISDNAGNESNAASQPLISVRKTHFQVMAGVKYQYAIRPGMSIYAGPVQTYGISPVYQTATDESIYLNRLGIKVGIVFD